MFPYPKTTIILDFNQTVEFLKEQHKVPNHNIVKKTLKNK